MSKLGPIVFGCFSDVIRKSYLSRLIEFLGYTNKCSRGQIGFERVKMIQVLCGVVYAPSTVNSKEKQDNNNGTREAIDKVEHVIRH